MVPSSFHLWIKFIISARKKQEEKRQTKRWLKLSQWGENVFSGTEKECHCTNEKGTRSQCSPEYTGRGWRRREDARTGAGWTSVITPTRTLAHNRRHQSVRSHKRSQAGAAFAWQTDPTRLIEEKTILGDKPTVVRCRSPLGGPEDPEKCAPVGGCLIGLCVHACVSLWLCVCH